MRTTPLVAAAGLLTVAVAVCMTTSSWVETREAGSVGDGCASCGERFVVAGVASDAHCCVFVDPVVRCCWGHKL